jgi:histidinol-phosphate phosphatase family protein
VSAGGWAIVVPTIGRPSLRVLLESLRDAHGPRPSAVIVVDDRPAGGRPMSARDLHFGGWVDDVLCVVESGGRGPAAARNVGWRATDPSSEWVVFLDDDVVVGENWLDELAADLARPADVVGVQGKITVPLPTDRRPTDWERGTAGLETSLWITADLAYRRAGLVEVGGFDERFPRAFREDADLALRLQDRGHRLVRGSRHTVHPVRPAPWNASLRQQRGNADDVLMRHLHGRGWHHRAEAPTGRRPMHLATTAAALTAVGARLVGHRPLAYASAAAWLAATAQFAWARIAPGPRTRDECARMITTSVLIPPAAVGHWLRGQWTFRRVSPWAPESTIAAVLVDRDGTIVHDVPYNGDPAAVRPVEDVPDAVRRLRAAGIKIGVITNQSGVARGLIDLDQVSAVNACIDELVGPFDTWQVCPHDDGDGCTCRKPQPGLIENAAHDLQVPVERCAVIGDTAADVGAGEAAGAAVSVLVPNPATRRDEVLAARYTAPTFASAVDLILSGRLGAAR